MSHSAFKAVTLLVWALLLAVAAWAYWPGVDGPALLDDASSLGKLENLAQERDLAMDYVLGDGAGALGRPVSMATFVAEKLWLAGTIHTSKAVNIVLHLVTATLVFWLFHLLLSWRKVPGASTAALLGAAAWLFSPFYVSTVLYAVQRMAMLSTLFMLGTCIAYLYWRRGTGRSRAGVAWLLLALALLLLALFSKENALVVVPVILLMELLWLDCRDSDGQPIPWLKKTVPVLIAGGALLVAWLISETSWWLPNYALLDFTPLQRLLTEARLLWYSVGQLLSPDVSTMGIFYDGVVPSRSLTAPPVTLYAVCGWFAACVLALGLCVTHWGRPLAFCLCWFLAGHSVESTILPLELFYEHRNYFPGVAVFLLLACLYGGIAKALPATAKPAAVFFACYVLWLALLTGSQAQVWSNSSLLRLNDVNAHPESFRAQARMAVELAKFGDLDAALDYSLAAHQRDAVEREGDYIMRDVALGCLARKPLPTGHLAKIGEANPERPLASVTTLNALVRLLQDDTCPGFDTVYFLDHMATVFLAQPDKNRAAPHVYSRLASLENSEGRFDHALRYIDLYLELRPGDTMGQLMKLHFATALNRTDVAENMKKQLLEKRARGMLTTQDQKTLALYLEK